LYHLDEHKHSLTDSQVLIAELGSGTDVKEVIKHAQGAWAIVWYDYAKHTLHMCRNKERTLYLCVSLDNKTMFWASEAWMLDQALEYTGLTKQYDVVKFVSPDKHLTWSTERHNTLKVRIGEAKGGIHRPFVRATPTAYGWASQTIKKIVNNVVPIEKGKTKAVEVEEDFEEEYTKGFNDNLIHRKKFEKLIQDGCSWCTGALFWEDRANIGWFDREDPLCCDCSQHLRDKYDYNVAEKKVN
jgi:hypothetical protein